MICLSLSFYFLYAVLNQIGQVASFVFTSTLFESELVTQAEELLARFQRHRPNSQQCYEKPAWFLDKCCEGTSWLQDGGWVIADIKVCGDNHHYQHRLTETVSVPQGASKAPLSAFSKDVATAFASRPGEIGIFPPAQDIKKKLYDIKTKFSLASNGAIWNAKSETALGNLKYHIDNCLTLPADLEPLVYDRHGDFILLRGTGGNEGLHRYLIMDSYKFCFF